MQRTPGSFEVSASFTTADNQTIDSPVVRFVVVNESGAGSHQAVQAKLLSGPESSPVSFSFKQSTLLERILRIFGFVDVQPRS